MRAKVYQGYDVLLLVTTLGKFLFFKTIFAHSTTPFDEVCLEPFVTKLPHGFGFCYTKSRSVST